ncbi:16S rRNA (uracil(1498)-N(3))-methyltransferase [Psychrobacter frigidicola]|uniref:Ribosomal RNA small subunit methyltransferase E n=1 Tax=Psychrobacter frigidicola TaxID=45611 RepID=A0A5C7A5R1_9GAMM|nr:16S rRNA (uracil(1498)-N(3))-methyltransferase [Psychrobacter frigidicola]TXD97980.1 16S rRNA (uracil(1498)-N(3))-methyltransferase [Psychrobacter frigidicola]
MRRFFYALDNVQDSRSNNTEHRYHKLSSFSIGTNIMLTESINHHWCRVLRANIGDEGILFDGFGGEYHVQLQTISKKQATVTLLAYIDEDHTAPIISKIGLVMSRGERMDYAIQKATELGVTAIQLLTSQHGEVSLKPAQVDKKLLHWQQVAIAACEQCGLNRPPLILAPLPINEWLSSLDNVQLNTDMAVSPIVDKLSQDSYYQILKKPADLRLMLSVPAAGQPSMPAALLSILKQAVLAQDKPYIELLIGSEGGLSDDECAKAERTGFMPWQIGARVLRTETAPVVALATLHALMP